MNLIEHVSNKGKIIPMLIDVSKVGNPGVSQNYDVRAT